MERFFDFIFGIRWWQWLLGMGAVAGLYSLVAGLLLPWLKGVQEEHEEDVERQRQEQKEREKAEERREHEAKRKEYLKAIPSGPVEPANLPPALVRARNHNVKLPLDAEVTFGTRRAVSVAIMSRGVSREHAKIRPEPRGYVLYDLMSETGTFVGDERIQSKVLADGDRFRIGPVEIVFKLRARSEDG